MALIPQSAPSAGPRSFRVQFSRMDKNLIRAVVSSFLDGSRGGSRGRESVTLRGLTPEHPGTLLSTFPSRSVNHFGLCWPWPMEFPIPCPDSIHDSQVWGKGRKVCSSAVMAGARLTPQVPQANGQRVRCRRPISEETRGRMMNKKTGQAEITGHQQVGSNRAVKRVKVTTPPWHLDASIARRVIHDSQLHLRILVSRPLTPCTPPL
jgi:hypothetical protein